MFHLLMGGEWNPTNDSLPSERVFEYTDDEIIERFEPASRFNMEAISGIPAVFSSEYHRDEASVVRIGTIHSVRRGRGTVRFRYTLANDLPPLTNRDLKAMAGDLDISDFEFWRTHWAIKDVDLFKALLFYKFPNRISPKVFRVDEAQVVDDRLLSVMMPFDGAFDDVYQTLKSLADGVGFDCLRADDIWNDPAVIQDVFDLIYKSRVVICDCTDRNPNVFYETGIAHTLGRDVILITQSKKDIPFDLTHLRYVPYLNNKEGLRKLRKTLKAKLEELE